MQTLAIRTDALAALRAALIGERQRLAITSADALELLAVPQNVAAEDQIPLLHEQFVVLNRHSADRRTLALVTAALERLDCGDYGTCEDCGGEISLKRLQVIPWASRCVTCQEQFESAGASRDGDSALSAYG